MINSATYRIELEDHTIGDLLRIYLLKNKDVKFAGYRVPHPLDDILEIKVQTTVEDTNNVVRETIKGLDKELWELEKDFDKVLIEKEKRGIWFFVLLALFWSHFVLFGLNWLSSKKSTSIIWNTQLLKLKLKRSLVIHKN